MKNYLPSKKFIIITIICLILGAIIFVIFFKYSKKENFAQKINNASLQIENQTIAELIQNDSDGDGVADWEEALWGTDKNKKDTFDNITDADYIAKKKAELGATPSADEENLSETDKFARQFFTSFTALKASGEVSSETINKFGSALGQKIANPNLIDRYSEKDIKTGGSDSLYEQKKYYADIKNLFESYKDTGLGDELDIVSNGLGAYSATDNEKQFDELLAIAQAYQDFAKKAVEMPVPPSLTKYHLQIANGANNTGVSVANMAKIINDPIVGLSGLSAYQKYSEDFMAAVADLQAFLQE